MHKGTVTDTVASLERYDVVVVVVVRVQACVAMAVVIVDIDVDTVLLGR